MTNLIYSENFNGKAIAIAQFADASGAPNKFLYYNGSLVYESSNGVVFSAMASGGAQTHNILATELIRQITAIGWVGNTVGVGSNAASISSPVADYYVPVSSVTSSNSGSLGFTVDNVDGVATVGTRAKAGFKVVPSTISGTFAITVPAKGDGTGTISLLDNFNAGPYTSAGPGQAAADATGMAALINALTYVHGYSAVTNVDDLFVFAPLSFGAVTFNMTVTTTGDTSTGATTHVANVPFTLTIVGTPTSHTGLFGLTTINSSKIVAKRTTAIATLQATATAHATSQVGISSYAWSAVGDTAGITLTNANTSTASFAVSLSINTQAVAQFKCVATDVVNNTVTTYCNVAFFYSTVTS